MDEVSLLISQRLEALQIRTWSSLDSAHVMLRGHLHNGVLWLNDVWAGERAQALRDAALHFHAWSIEMLLRAKSSLSHMNFDEAMQRMREIYLSEIGGPRLCWGCVGAVSGIFIGLSLGISIGKRWKPKGRLPGMRAVVCKGCQGLDEVTMLDELQCPTITSPDQMIIQVRCTSVDPVDIKVCCGYGRVLRKHLGKYHPTVSSSEFPLILGRDGAGVVVEVGDEVRGFMPGDEVWFAIPPWIPGGGTMSQLLLVRGIGEAGGDKLGLERGQAVSGLWGSVIAHKPRGVGFEGAATVPFSACSAWEAATVGAGLRPDTARGKRVLVHGGTTGVGILLIQLLSAWGAHVVTVVGHHGAHLARRLLPAEDVLLYEEKDGMVGAGEGGSYHTKLQWSEKFDVVFNTVGPEVAETCLESCIEADPGRGIKAGVVVTTYARPIASDSRGILLGAVCSVWACIRSTILSTLEVDGQSVGWVKVSVARDALTQFGHLIEEGRVIPVVGKIFPVGDAELAFQHADTTDPLGKTVIRFSTLASSTLGAMDQWMWLNDGFGTRNQRAAARDVAIHA